MLIGLYLALSMLYIAQSIILPLIYGTIVAIVLDPLVSFLVRKGLSRGIASLTVMLLSVIIIAAVISLISLQAGELGTAWPNMKLKLEGLLLEVTTFLANNFNLSQIEIDGWRTQLQDEMLSNSGNKIGITIITMGSFISAAMLTPVYTFMLLYYQPHLIGFIHNLFGTSYNVQVNEILTKTKSLIQRYLLGLGIEFVILSVLNAAGLWLIGIDYPILLGVLGALLNIIPYLGGIIGVSIYMIVALVTKSPLYVMYVVILYSFIQLVDNNYIVPKIVGSKVKLNALVSFFAVIAGAALWGLPGMFLSIPFVAIIKLILDHIKSLEHWGTLLGDPISTSETLPESNQT